MRQAARTAEIVQAAAHLWADRGYHGVGVEELSQTVGLQRGALYHYIGSKEELLHEVVRQAICRLLDRTSDDEELLPAERLRALSRTLMREISEHQAEWTVFFREISWLTGARRDEIFAMREEYEQLWVRVLESGVACGDLRPVDPVLVKGILGMHNYSYLWLRPDGPLSPTEIADIFTNTVLHGIDREAISGG